MDVDKIISKIRNGDFKDVKRFIKENHDKVNQRSSDSKTFLMAACEQGSTSLIASLIESGANIDMSDEEGQTALYYAVESHRTDSVAFLVSSGANVNKHDSGGYTPLHWAVWNNYEDVVKVLLNSKENNNLQVNQKNILGWTALHFACCCGSKDVVELLLQQKDTDVKAETKDRWTGLHFASVHGSKDVVELLLQQKDTDVNAVTKQGSTPLHLASTHGYKEVVDFLLKQKGIDVNKVNLKGDTPLHLAVQKCMLCEENEASMELQPCAHTVLCEDCSKIQLKRCPKCKTCIESKRRVVCPKCKEKAVKTVVVYFECPNCKEKVDSVESVTLEEKHLHWVSQKLAGKWQPLGRELGIRQYELDNIKENNPLNVEEQGFQMLLRWQQGNDPEKRTLQILKEALERTGCHDALKCLSSEFN